MLRASDTTCIFNMHILYILSLSVVEINAFTSQKGDIYPPICRGFHCHVEFYNAVHRIKCDSKKSGFSLVYTIVEEIIQKRPFFFCQRLGNFLSYNFTHTHTHPHTHVRTHTRTHAHTRSHARTYYTHTYTTSYLIPILFNIYPTHTRTHNSTHTYIQFLSDTTSTSSPLIGEKN